MSYQVLARKWRPKTFREMAGQGHVLKALINALDHDRLHHAYLFTGTRGVGKTTIARILAKCLNCETGVSSEPCGQCPSCVAIAEGRFVDLIEVDAASRTKVEDTRELLDNVQYAPTAGRYKVYLIDEVHMLSSSSFNALLKTLEEPPPHVKFLLATTDPQKIPATILSRCLQFSLKNLSAERIVDYLKTVLEQEMVAYDEPALWLLGRAADGSMRDALSLTDQAIAFGSGKLGESDVGQMLGTIDHGAVYRLIEALAQRDGAQLLAIVAELAELGVDFAAVATELLTVLHRLAIAQTVPEGLDNSLGDRERLLTLAASLTGEQVQFYYQMALNGRRDLGLAPDLRAGLEMLLLRILAFCPQGVLTPPQEPIHAGQGAASPAKKPVSAPTVGAPPDRPQTNNPAADDARAAVLAQFDAKPSKLEPSKHEPSASEQFGRESPLAEPSSASITSTATQQTQSVVSEPERAIESAPALNTASPEPVSPELAPPASVEAKAIAPSDAEAPSEAAAPSEAEAPVEKLAYAQLTTITWREQFSSFALSGMLGSVASHCQIASKEDTQLRFVISESNTGLLNDQHPLKLAEQLGEYFELELKVLIEVADFNEETPFEYARRRQQEKLAELRSDIENNPQVKRLLVEFDAHLELDSLRLAES
ncbi:DNA polymerase III subunit gamma/tau [Spongiibacter sp. KMU-158]|uniref:DNA polymerase III subunit gamma/tau n=1 Tax=Spongiibacter pelagi TaxID=2760804 RepID=A0A927C272_9GAMM|nr:DNA polymerase III subunit gamma/tau [Spongiibacter pelagi]MBD2858507.1 DNA polymerase III subunit gamma/tau [Spongiibacter pelagi]